MISTLVYIPETSNMELRAIAVFLKELDIRIKTKNYILCENNIDRDFMLNELVSLSSNKTFSILDKIKSLKNNWNNYDDYFDYIEYKYSKKDKNGISIHENKNIKLVEDLETYIQTFIRNNQINAIIYSPCLSATFRSMGLLLLNNISDQLNVPFYWIARTPLKGRFGIYDNLFCQSKKLNHYYYNIINNNEVDISLVKNYFNEYINFKVNVHLPFFQSIKKNNLSILFSKQTIKRILLFLSDFIFRSFSNYFFLPRYDNNKSYEKEYILLLLTKPNHWYTSYANRENLNRKNLIENIRKNIPDNFNLILRPHPRNNTEFSLRKKLKNLPNTYIDFSTSFHELVEKSVVVIYNGTTAGVESLMQIKHVIEIGNKSILFDFKNPPIIRVDNLKDLRLKIEECLSVDPPAEKIYSFFYALLKNSYSFQNNDQNISLLKDNITFKKMANIFSKQLLKDFK